MPLTFKTRLRASIPIGKLRWQKETLEYDIEDNEVLEKAREWLAELDEITRIRRQNRKRAYTKLPEYYLMYFERNVHDAAGRQRWKKILKVRAWRSGEIKIDRVYDKV